jgi:hypothetical protein
MLAMRCARGKPFKHRGYLGFSPAALGVTDSRFCHYGEAAHAAAEEGIIFGVTDSRFGHYGNMYVPANGTLFASGGGD